MFGLDLLVIGGFLLYASRQPQKYIALVWLVIALEIVRGIMDDLYMIVQGYNAAFMLGFIILHLLVIIPGAAFTREAANA